MPHALGHLFDTYDAGDEIKRAAVLPPEQILAGAQQRTDQPGMAAIQQPSIDINSVLGPAPARDERSQRINRLLTLGGALATLFTGGEGPVASIGAGLARGGSQALREGDVRFAQAMQARQERAQELRGVNREIQGANIDRRADVRQFEREQAAEEERAAARAEEQLEEVRTRGAQELEQIEAREQAERETARLEAETVTREEQLDRELTEADIATEEARRQAQLALAAQRRANTGGADEEASQRLEAALELEGVSARLDAVNRRLSQLSEDERAQGLEPFTTLSERQLELQEERAALQAVSTSPAQDRMADAQALVEAYTPLLRKGDTATIGVSLTRQLDQGVITEAQAEAVLDALGL